MNSWSTFSPYHGASSVSQWSYGSSIYVHTQDTIHTLTHTQSYAVVCKVWAPRATLYSSIMLTLGHKQIIMNSGIK